MSEVQQNTDYINIEEFNKIYLDFYPIVFNCILNKVGDREEALDICQDVFIVLLNNFNSIENKRTWLFGTLKNMVLNYYKKKNSAKARLFESSQDFDEIGVSFVNGFQDTRIVIKEAIESLQCDDLERSLLEYIAMNNFTYNETAQILGKSRRQIEYGYSMVIKKLMLRLKELGIDRIEDLL
jgi:RNA polymerase sigma-70 factor (ECF subfamily)